MSVFFLAIPLVLSAYTHLWNVIGFPAIHPDEGVYMRRTMLILKNLGPHDDSARFDHPPTTSMSSYDHPYFGQIFLAVMLSMIGYPNSLNPSAEDGTHSVEMLYLAPRVLMGILAVLDTFLVYKIADRRYNRNVALIASVIFAVMPLSWLYRWILLDSILLPFLLSSVFLAIYKQKPESFDTEENHKKNVININTNIPILLSGILLGLAIYTKIPAFTMIPLVGYLVYKNNKSLKTLGLWIIPVILIPLMWPAYSISVGQFDEWVSGVLWQGTERHTNDAGLPDIELDQIFNADPVLILLGSIGVIFAALKKDFFLLLWIIPCVVFFYLIGWVILFHWIPILPAFCFGIGVLIEYISHRISKKRIIQKSLLFGPVFAIGIFGLVTTTMIITTNLSSSEFEAAAFIVKYLQGNYFEKNVDKNYSDDVTIITSPIYSWIYKYAFNRDHITSHIRDSEPIRTAKVILVVDGVYQSFLSKESQEDKLQYERIRMIYNNTHTIAIFSSDDNNYNEKRKVFPYQNLIVYSWAKKIQVRTNY